MHSAGNKRKTTGKMSLIVVLPAASSARWRRLARRAGHHVSDHPGPGKFRHPDDQKKKDGKNQRKLDEGLAGRGPGTLKNAPGGR